MNERETEREREKLAFQVFARAPLSDHRWLWLGHCFPIYEMDTIAACTLWGLGRIRHSKGSKVLRKNVPFLSYNAGINPKNVIFLIYWEFGLFLFCFFASMFLGEIGLYLFWFSYQQYINHIKWIIRKLMKRTSPSDIVIYNFALYLKMFLKLIIVLSHFFPIIIILPSFLPDPTCTTTYDNFLLISC
jgi:hypothetical protein